MNRINRRAVGAALALASGAAVIGFAAPASDAATVQPAVYHWACNYGGESARIWYRHGSPAPVKQAQCLLNYAGYRIQIDGLVGDATNNAVLSFQSRHHLTRDGIVGPKTWAALDKYNHQVNTR